MSLADPHERDTFALDELDELDPLSGDATRILHNHTPATHDVPAGHILYDDYASIDWLGEAQRERRRRLAIEQDGTSGSDLRRLWNRAQIWVVLGLTGALTGVLAASIDVVNMWLGDLKEGICKTSFYSSRQFCCLGLAEDVPCSEWLGWNDMLSLSSAGGGYMVNYIAYVVLATGFASTAAFLVTNYAPYASHSGIPEVKAMLSGIVIRHFAGKWTLMIKTVGLCLAVSSGLWLGKEGPLVHIAVCLGSICIKLLPGTALMSELRKRDIFTAASAAGMAVAFGAPIGGVLFALEQISYFFPDRIMWQSFVCAMVASVSLQLMNPFRTGKLVRYEVAIDRDWRDFELVPFLILGVVGGLYGAIFYRLNKAVAQFRLSTRLKDHPTLEVAVLALLTALISFPNVFSRMQAARVLTDLLQECSQGNWLDLCSEGRLLPSVLLLLSASVLGTVLSAVTFGARIPAGIMLPTMIVGAALGRVVGMLMQQWHRSFHDAWIFASCSNVASGSDAVGVLECVTPGVYAVIGAAAALAGVTRMTVSLVVIMFELTGALTYVLPIMVSVVVAKWVADFLVGKQGVYELWIQIRGFSYLDKEAGAEDYHGLSVVDIMTPIEEICCLRVSDGNTNDSIESVLSMTIAESEGFPVLHIDTGALIGYVQRNRLRHALSAALTTADSPGWTKVELVRTKRTDTSGSSGSLASEGQRLDLSHLVDATPLILTTAASIRLVASLFQQTGVQYVFIGERGIPSGIVTRRNLIERAHHRYETW
ncbi:chloride channel [Savitreella phatthalungensis]